MSLVAIDGKKKSDDTAVKRVTTSVQNSKGKWVPAIPEPYYCFLRVQCECGEYFRSVGAYRGHYALKHILFI